MTKRDNWTEEMREAERIKNRERMRRKMLDPEYRAKVNARRKARDADRKKKDPELRKRLTKNSLRHFHRKKSDSEFMKKRVIQNRKWRNEARADRQFDHVMDQMERGEDQ